MSVTRKLLEKLRRKPYREAYVEENVRTGIAHQIRALRDARGWSQKKLAELLGKPQSVVSRIEDPDYGKLSLQTLLEVASVFDVAVLVQFADFPEFVHRMSNVSPEALNKQSFSETQFVPAETTVDALIITESGSRVVVNAHVIAGATIVRHIGGGVIVNSTTSVTAPVTVSYPTGSETNVTSWPASFGQELAPDRTRLH